MKKYQFHARHLWPLTLGVIFALFFSFHRNASIMNRVWWGVVFPLERAVAHVTALTTLSVAELLILAAGAAAFFGLINALRRRKMKEYLSILLGSVLTVYAGFCLLWGTAYAADDFQKHAGLTARGGTVEELTAVTAQFARELAALVPQIPRGEDGVFSVSVQEILDDASKAYTGAEREFPFLHRDHLPPKAFVASRALSALDFSGFYFPFTAEANVNIDAPAVYLPATICHEMAHQRGYASEKECTFLGIFAARTCGIPAYQYSGTLEGYVYLSNALYRQDREAWQTIRDSLPTEALADLAANSQYWAQFRTPVKTVSNAVYDGFLKANGDTMGIQSYGTVVDLLLAWYG